jgi:hypothetical protein
VASLIAAAASNNIPSVSIAAAGGYTDSSTIQPPRFSHLSLSNNQITPTRYSARPTRALGNFRRLMVPDSVYARKWRQVLARPRPRSTRNYPTTRKTVTCGLRAKIETCRNIRLSSMKIRMAVFGVRRRLFRAAIPKGRRSPNSSRTSAKQSPVCSQS